MLLLAMQNKEGEFQRKVSKSLKFHFTLIRLLRDFIARMTLTLFFSLANDSFTTAASTLSIGDFCKICHCGSEINQPLIAPCFCSGSLKFVHQECLQKWIKSSDIKRCELCKYPFDMQAKVSNY